MAMAIANRTCPNVVPSCSPLHLLQALEPCSIQAISIGIRDDNTLASIWMLHFTTMCFGFLVPLAAPRLG